VLFVFLLIGILKLIFMGQVGNAYKILIEKPKEREHAVYFSVDVRILLWILKK
jgi:hypothetical protein